MNLKIVGKISQMHILSQPKNGINTNIYLIKQFYLIWKAIRWTITLNSCHRTTNIHTVTLHSCLTDKWQRKTKTSWSAYYWCFVLLFIALQSCKGNIFLIYRMWKVFSPFTVAIIYQLFTNYNIRWLWGYWGELATRSKHCTSASTTSVNQNGKVKLTILIYL